MLASVRQWFEKQYWLGAIPALLVLVYRDFIPKYLTDDPVRLVSVRRVFEPSFLSHEWLQLAGYDEDRLTILFKLLFAPLWLWLKNGILFALSTRLLVWAIVLYAIVRLARAINIPRYALGLGLLYWVEQGQSMGVGEWVLGGAEGKCLAYAAIFLAIESFLRERRTLAAFFCGLAFWFHVPVGLWGVLAVYGAFFLSQREHKLKAVWQPLLITFCTSLPMAYFALQYAGVSLPPGGLPATDWLIVVFRNPHHLDPTHFGGWRVLLRLIVCVVLTIVGLKELVPDYRRRFLSGFMSILLLEFTFGLAARQFSFFWYLKTYPFRVADVLIFFLCCLVLPKLAVKVLSGASTSKYLSHTTPAPRIAAAAFLIVIFMSCTFSVGLARSEKFFVRQFATSWEHFLHRDKTPYQEMAGWIKANTPESAVMIVPPWLDDFPLEAERAPVVNFRRNPHNGLIVEWYRRYCAMNGGTFHSVGLDTLTEVQKNYVRLSSAQLDEIRKSYGGEYYLTVTKRDDLNAQLVHETSGYYLYSLPLN